YYLFSTVSKDMICFCNATPSTDIYTLSLHDALPIYAINPALALGGFRLAFRARRNQHILDGFLRWRGCALLLPRCWRGCGARLGMVAQVIAGSGGAER